MVKVPKDLTKLSDDELAELWSQTAQAALEAREDNKRVADEVHDRETKAAVQAKLDSMNDVERAALAQAVRTVGIESQEAVNG
jgi:hypothetical protein